MKTFNNQTCYQFTGDVKRPFTEALKSLFLKSRSWGLVNARGNTLLQDYANGIFRRPLTTDEFRTLQTAFFDDFRRWRELLLKASRRIVAKYRELNR